LILQGSASDPSKSVLVYKNIMDDLWNIMQQKLFFKKYDYRSDSL
jgi:hypothetical protein